MDILFVIDRLELKYFEFNDLVTNFWMIKELLASVESGKLKVESSSSHAPSPDGERICGRTERSESGLRKDGAYCGEATNAELLEQRANSRQGWDGVILYGNSELPVNQQNVTNFSTIQPFNHSTSNSPHPYPPRPGRELTANVFSVYITTIDLLSLKSAIPYAGCYETFEKDGNIFYKKELKQFKINDFDLVIFRPDPPVDTDYINATYIFDFVDRNKTVILNDPKAIRNFNEKLHAVKFLDLMPENIVTSSKADIMEFLNEHNEIVLKPLNGCFGSGVMTLTKGDRNTAVIINTMTDNGKRKLMVQKYIPMAKYGDKRVLFLGDEVLDWCIQKLPSNDDFKFNEHCDNNIIKAELTPEEKEKFASVARELNKMGLPMVGLDVIDGKIIEINVTSPCYFIRENNHHHGIHLEKKINEFILSKCPTPVL